MTIPNWIIREARVIYQLIDAVDTNQNHALGSKVRAKHSLYGEGTFIYLPGVTGCVVGSVVVYDNYNSTTALAPSTANLARPLAVAMAAHVAGTFGWFQETGEAVCATNGTLTAASSVYLAGNGQFTSTQAAGKHVLSAISSTATGTPAAGLAVVQINEPVAQGQIV